MSPFFYANIMQVRDKESKESQLIIVQAFKQDGWFLLENNKFP
jgi:hypothetical protein